MRMSTKKKQPSVHGPMNQLEELVRRAGIRLKTADDAPAEPALVRPPGKPDPVYEELPAGISDDDLFIESMDGVDRVSWKHHPFTSSRPARPAGFDPEAEDRRLMREALENDSPIAIPDHPEYIEGWVGVAGKRFLPNLRNGLYSIQGQIDLHGLNRAEAQIAVEEYIVRMSRFRSCCVKIIHGRGINSPSDRTTLKDSLQRLLSTRRMSRYVVAYASAPSRDGGVGAVYVLLKHPSLP